MPGRRRWPAHHLVTGGSPGRGARPDPGRPAEPGAAPAALPRYLTFTHLLASPRCREELQRHRHALAKLVNSLSWHPRITRPHAVDPAQTVFRIDLRDYQWNARQWDRLAAAYPYRSASRATPSRKLAAADRLRRAAGARRLVRRHRVAGRRSTTTSCSCPPATAALERLLQRRRAGQPAGRQRRPGRLQRLRRRPRTTASSNGTTAATAPTGGATTSPTTPAGRTSSSTRSAPAAGSNAFQHAGGEIIFNLPNGLQAYLLVDGNGQRIDKAPAEIVSDPKRPDRLVENGLSCMSCHVRGLLPKDDQVRAHVLKNADGVRRGRPGRRSRPCTRRRRGSRR